MKKITYILIVVLIIIGGVWFLRGSKLNSANVSQTSKTTSSNSSLIAQTDFYDFGTIDINGGKVQTDFILENIGDGEIVITDGTTSCGCTEGEIEGVIFGMHENLSRSITVQPHATDTLIVIFDPLAHGPSGVGLIQRLVMLKTNSKITPEVQVKIKALVVNK